jgi:hypothetical protein
MITPIETGASSLENVLIVCWTVVLVEEEVVLVEPRDQPVERIGHRERHQHEIHIHANPLPGEQ